jgi:hypothetical protein
MGELRFVAVVDLDVESGSCWVELRLSEPVDEVRAGFIQRFDLDPGGRVNVGRVEEVAGDRVRLRATSKEQLAALVRALQEWGLTKAIERQAAHEQEIADLRSDITGIIISPPTDAST